MPPSLFTPTPTPLLTSLLHDPLQTLTTLLYTTQPPVLPPPPLHPPLRIVCISDTHNVQPTLSAGDMVLHAGDLSVSGSEAEVARQVGWLKGIAVGREEERGGSGSGSARRTEVVAIAGNHDISLDASCHAHHRDMTFSNEEEEEEEEARREKGISWTPVHYLNRATAHLHLRGRSVRLHGSPWTRRQGNWAFQYAPSCEDGIWAAGTVPVHTDVLLTHGPSRGHLDTLRTRGSRGLLAELWRVRPRVHVHGHVHEGRGVEVLDWGAVQWGYDRVVGGGVGGLRGWVAFAVVGMVRVVSWMGFLLVGRRRRRGVTVVVNAAWEGNEGRGVSVVEI